MATSANKILEFMLTRESTAGKYMVLGLLLDPINKDSLWDQTYIANPPSVTPLQVNKNDLK